jgi:membrane fusion protein (multidrug efflux system)
VRKGDILFRLDGKQQQANLLSARASLESARAKALEAHNNYIRAIPLAKIDAISQTQLDQYTAEYVAAEASVKSAEQTLRNAELDVEYTTIRSTINGVISTSAAHIGDLVGPGTKFPTLTTIQNVDTVTVDIAIPMRQYLSMSGRKSFSYENADLLSDIRLYLADGEPYPAVGTYSYTKTAVSGATGTIIIVVSFANPDYLLKAGQFARVETNVGAGQSRVTIPQSCVSQTQNINSVWVIRPDSTAEYREIALGQVEGGRWIIDSGLNAGEKVVVSGQIKLRNGAKVNPQNTSNNE